MIITIMSQTLLAESKYKQVKILLTLEIEEYSECYQLLCEHTSRI